MGCHLIIGKEQGRQGRDCSEAVMFCSTTGWAFGPVFTDDDEHGTAEEQAERFMAWLDNDPRRFRMDELEAKHTEWIKSGRPGGRR